MPSYFYNTGGAPSNLQVVQTGMNMVRLTWSPPPGPSSRGYQIDYTGNITIQTSSTTLAINTLPFGEYSFQVTSLPRHFPGGTVGPETITVRGKIIV